MSRFPPSLLDTIRDNLKISEVVGDFVIWDKKKSMPQKGDFWGCCPFHGEKSPSFHADDRRGFYHCFGCGVSGDCFRFLTEKAGYDFPEAVEKLAARAGVQLPERDRHEETPEHRQAREEKLARENAERDDRIAKERAKDQRRKEFRTQSAIDVLNACIDLEGTHGERYIVERGIAPISDWPWKPTGVLMFHPKLEVETMAVWEDGRKIKAGPEFPAVVCRIQDAFGDSIACWQIFLHPTKPIKAPIDNPKIGRGPSAGGAIRIGGDGPDIDVSEGFESALGAWELDHYSRPSWSLTSTSGMVSFEPPIFVKKVRTWPDADRGKLDKETREVRGDPSGLRAAKAMHDRLVQAGIQNPINDMTRFGDSLDMLVARKAFDRKSA